MKHFKRIVLAAFAVALVGSSVLPVATAIAESSSSSASLSIAPKKNYVVEPGKSVEDKLTIRNLDSEDSLSLTLRVVDFSYTDDTGTPKLMLDENAPQTTWSMKPFLEIPKTVTIEPGKTTSVDMKVSVPSTQGAGSFYSAIVYSSGSGEGGNVGLSASGVTLVFTNIPGKVNENLQLEKFGPYQPSTPGKSAAYYPLFTTQEPDTFGYTLKNSGNVVEAPVGSIKLKNMFGKEYSIDRVNPNGSLALIGQTRTFTVCIKSAEQTVDFNGTRTEASTCVSPGLWPGYYQTSIELYYGQNGNTTQEIIKNGGFWYLPWWFIIITVAVLALLGYFIWRFVRFVRMFRNPNKKK